MLRRTVSYLEKLVIVESPNKVIKIEGILSNPKVIPDWSFRQGHLKCVGVGAEKAVAMATAGHFMALKEINWTIHPARLADVREKPPEGDSETFPINGTLSEYTVDWELLPSRRIQENLERYMGHKVANISEIILATDPDREGELIAVHAIQTIKRLYPKLRVPFSRAYMHSITEDGIRKAMKERNINMCDYDLASAAETRHVMDRIFGFLGSSVVRAANSQMRSIGRVQTPALILINEREERIKTFLEKNKPYFVMEAMCQFPVSHGVAFIQVVTVHPDRKGAPSQWKTEAEAQSYLQRWKMTECHSFTLSRDPVVTTSKIPPPEPLTMATAITKINRQLKMNSEMVSSCLQDLFQLGHITYPRTDSTRIDESVLPDIYNAIKKNYGKELLYRLEDQVDATERGKKKKKHGKKSSRKGKADAVSVGNVEDAHEAIRPTNINVEGDSLSLAPETRAIYELVRRQTLAAFMIPQTLEKIVAEVRFVSGSGEKLSVTLDGRRVVEPGWTRAFQKGDASNASAHYSIEDVGELGDEGGPIVPSLSQEEFNGILNLRNVINSPVDSKLFGLHSPTIREHRPVPPMPHSEGTLIEELKRNGVGRPSTYPTIVKTLLARSYIQVNVKGRCETTPLGRMLVETAKSTFPSIVDIGFPASFEKQLDTIAKPNPASQPALSHGTKISQADYVLSMFFSTFLNYVSEATCAQRSRIVERSMRLKRSQEGGSGSELEFEESVATAMKKVALTSTDLVVLTKTHNNFSSLQRGLNEHLRHNFPQSQLNNNESSAKVRSRRIRSRGVGAQSVSTGYTVTSAPAASQS
uniref:DNA topoisomerase n=1 Tax=Trypanosoma congolense (strain IL3000) TaxID=1068625 RepID=G0UVI6_TRYCI|nr:putative DNA topoisomerase IA [Trypanosoma congolense IL3000]